MRATKDSCCWRSARLVAGLLVCAGALTGCDKVQALLAKDAEDSTQTATQLGVELPPGLDVAVDGNPQGKTPLSAFNVAAGPHEVTVTTPCGPAKATVEVSEGGTTILGVDTFEGLGFATLNLDVSRFDDEPLSEVAVEFGDWKAPYEPGKAVQVPACALRMKVSTEGLGAFIENLDLNDGETLERKIVLAPGPDMVRIEGGKFALGPPGPPEYDPAYEYVPGEWEGLPVPMPTFDVEIPTFDIDRTEVTARQFYECELSGACAWDSTRMTYANRPDEGVAQHCTHDPTSRTRKPTEGKEDFPANCIGRWEAEAYCDWAKKRLPTDAEWEYAGRSRKTENVCPWGGDMATIRCDRSPETGLALTPVCSFPKDNTLQGLCDFGGSVQELVSWAMVPGRPERPGADAREHEDEGLGLCRGYPDFGTMFDIFDCRPYDQRTGIGFRCAR